MNLNKFIYKKINNNIHINVFYEKAYRKACHKKKL